MAAAQAYYLVKILSGSHAGAEVRLVTGAYRVGRDDDADVVLEDHALAGEHALVTIEAEGVKVEPLMGAVTVNGAPHAEPARRLPFFAVVGLGATYLAVGPEGAAWPSLAPPTPAGLAAIADQPAQALVPAQAPAARPRAWARPWLPLLLLPLLLLLLLRPFGQASAPEPPRAPEDPAVRLAAAEGSTREALAGLPVTGLKVTPDSRRERLIVEGWTPTEAERKDVLERLGKLDVPLTPHFYSRDQVMAGVATTLQALGRQLETAWAGPGEVRLRGYMPDASDLQRVVDLLRRDIPGLDAIDNEVMTDESIEAWLRQRLAEAGLGEALRVRRGERALQVRGTLTPEQRPAALQVANAYSDGPGRYLPLEVQIGEATGPANVAPVDGARPDLRLVGTVGRGGQLTALVARAGTPGAEPLTEGDVIDSWQVTDVTEDRMVLTRGGERAVYAIFGGGSRSVVPRRARGLAVPPLPVARPEQGSAAGNGQ